MLMVSETYQRRLPPVVLAGAALLAVFVALLAYVLPAVPVDETRYLTVAWEMHLSHHWFLETVNGQPYSHKPPLLFWLINLVWAATGPQLWSARLIAGAAALGAYLLTWRLARTLYPDRPLVATLAPLLLLGCPAFLTYGGLIMFDTLLTCFVLLALEQVWRAARGDTDFWRAWLLFGLFTGIGVLVKGPVVALYVAFPSLLAPLFLPGAKSRSRWYGGLAAGLLVATLIGLAWAIPAAVAGGKAFAEMLFVKQSAGRMVDSFAHRRPFWFYIPCWPVFALPFLCWPPFWRSLRTGREAVQEAPALFLAAAILGPFLCFSAISGKQVHYMLPLLPGAAIFLAALLDRAAAPLARPRDAFGFAGLLLALFIAGVIALHQPAALNASNRLVAGTAAQFMAPLFGAAVVAAFAAAFALRRRPEGQVLAIAFGLMAFSAATLWQAGRTILPDHDLRSVASLVQPYKNGSLAYAEKYDGEIGFVARLPHPMDVLDLDGVDSWLKDHPDGTVVVRYDQRKPVDFKQEIIGKTDYRADQGFAVLRAARKD